MKTTSLTTQFMFTTLSLPNNSVHKYLPNTFSFSNIQRLTSTVKQYPCSQRPLHCDHTKDSLQPTRTSTLYLSFCWKEDHVILQGYRNNEMQVLIQWKHVGERTVINLTNTRRWMVSFSGWPLCSRRKCTRNPPSKKLGGLYSSCRAVFSDQGSARNCGTNK